MISLVIPVYNEEESLWELYARLARVCAGLGDYEVIFVNDGSSDNSLSLLRAFRQENDRVKIITFSRNFGHQKAITAGIDYASGDAVVILDGDLQDPPELILKLLEEWKKGYKVVYAQRARRDGEGFFKKTAAHLFYKLFRYLTRYPLPENVGDFRLIDRRVVQALKEIKEEHRFMRGLVTWVGFSQHGVTFVRDPRFAGKTKYPFGKMVLFAIEALTSFSTFPLRIAVYLGFVITVFSFLLSVYVLVVQFVFKDTVQGWTSLILIVLFLGGIQLMVTGVMGEYIGRIYEEVKRRPLYIVESIEGF